MTYFAFAGENDPFGRPVSQTTVAAPRRSARRLRLSAMEVADETRALATHSRTAYADPAPGVYIHDRMAHGTTLELRAPPELTESDPDDVVVVLREHADSARAIHERCESDLAGWRSEDPLPPRYRIVGHTVNRYDGGAYQGLGVGRLGARGALTRSDTLAFTRDTMRAAYGNDPLIDGAGRMALPPGAPAGLGTDLGYRWVAGEPGYVDGFYLKAQQRKYDVHDPAVATEAGLVVAQRDPLDHETTIAYDAYGVLPETVVDPVNLETRTRNSYRVMQPAAVIDPNDNVTTFTFSSMGLLTEAWVRGKAGANEGDRAHASTELAYDFLAYRRSVATDPAKPQPIGVRTIRHVRHDTDPDDTGETIETCEYSDGFGRLLQTRTQGEDVRFGDPVLGGGEAVLPARQSAGRGGPLTGRRTSTARPNVTVSGWQRYDNKGRVVEKYEPFFDAGWEYDPPGDDRLGRKVMLFYDPRGQVVRTVAPDGFEERIIYGIPRTLDDPPRHPGQTHKFAPTPWEAYTYDADDNAGRTHAGEARSYRHCFDTPASVLVDPLGRTLLAVARKRDRGASLAAALPPIEEYRTRSTYDIQGNALTITDPLGRVAFRFVYDLRKRVWRSESVDAGTKRMVLDAVANEVQRRDGKGAISLRAYDPLKRPTEVWARDAAAGRITLRERVRYGEDGDRVVARRDNALGKVVEYSDEAGVVATPRYDFRGNPLRKTRRVVSDGALTAGWTADWSDPGAAADLDPTEYETSTRYDALSRPTEVLYPAAVDGRRAALMLVYDRGGRLEQLALDGDVYVERIAYNAKGQRVLIAHGNGVLTRYAYDPRTFRLARLRSERFIRAGAVYQPNGAALQDAAYDHDATGNLLGIHERVPGCGLPNAPDQLDRLFGYDSLYRLVTATGRECAQPTPDPYWLDPARCQDVTSTRGYAETYAYDAAGNLTQLVHTASGNGSFRRSFTIAAGGNRLDRVMAGTTVLGYRYDGSGNMTREASSRRFDWDHADRLQAFEETAGATPSVEARYLYDAEGTRVKKWVRRNGGGAADESTVYVGGSFEHHRWRANGGGENNQLHLMDNQNRVAIVRVGGPHPDDGGPAVQYHLGDHVGSSAVVLDEVGSVVNGEEFYPHGETSFGSFTRKRYRYTGQERDEESRLCLHKARYYVPWVGRWASSDPAGLVDGLNLYAFARDNPLLFVDRTGHQGDKVDGGMSHEEIAERGREMVAAGYVETQIEEYLNAQATCQSVASECHLTEKQIDDKIKEARGSFSEFSKPAQENLNHYLGKSGEELKMSSKVFADHAKVKEALRTTFREKFIEGVKSRLEGRNTNEPAIDPKAPESNVDLEFVTGVEAYSLSKTDPLGFSVGGFVMRVKVNVTVIKTGADTYRVEFKKWESQVFDVYNWDAGKTTIVDGLKKIARLPSDTEMCCLENSGRGKAFLIRTDPWTTTNPKVVKPANLKVSQPNANLNPALKP